MSEVAGVRDEQAAARGARALTVPLLAVTVATCSCTTLAGAAAARIGPRSPAAPRSLAAPLAASGTLAGVAALFRRQGLGVGSTGNPNNPKTLIEHWNGITWRRVPSPHFAAVSVLAAVTARSTGTARSAATAWAVGSTANNKTLILHWNGTAWERAPSPSPSVAPPRP